MGSNGMLHAFILDGSGNAELLDITKIKQWTPEDGILWLHLNYTDPLAVQFIMSDKYLDDLSKEFLLSEETRPRTTKINNSLMLAFRGVNFNPGADPEDMVSMRLWANENRIITTIRRNLMSVQDIVQSCTNGVGPSNSSEFVVDIARQLIRRMSDVFDTIEDRLAELEEKIIEDEGPELRKHLSNIRRESIAYRRYLSPQRESMIRLYGETIEWLQDIDRLRLREATDQLIRYIEDLDSIRDRATVLHEELVSHISEQTSNRMYVLSLVAAIFLPLSFLTGLFGINVGGIPGSNSKIAFLLFVLVLLGISIVLFWVFKKKKWI